MEFPAFLRRPGMVGSRFSGVFSWKSVVGDLAEVVMLGTDQHMMFTSPLPMGTFTVYDAIILETDPLFLGLDESSRVVPYIPSEGFNQNIKQICAGMGLVWDASSCTDKFLLPLIALRLLVSTFV